MKAFCYEIKRAIYTYNWVTFEDPTPKAVSCGLERYNWFTCSLQ